MERTQAQEPIYVPQSVRDELAALLQDGDLRGASRGSGISHVTLGRFLRGEIANSPRAPIYFRAIADQVRRRRQRQAKAEAEAAEILGHLRAEAPAPQPAPA